MKDYKKYVDAVKKHLKTESLEIDNEMLDMLVSQELKKSAEKMDKYLIDLCLNALVAYRKCSEESKDKQ